MLRHNQGSNGCRPNVHRPQTKTAKRILSRVGLACLLCLLTLSGCTANPQLVPFTSDGCSLFPDRSLINEEDWCLCCVEHDLAYWQGGEEIDRKAADERLKACIEERTRNGALAELMYNGVRLGGSPHFPTWYRWGYGWSGLRGYRPLTLLEHKKIRRMLRQSEGVSDKGACGAK